MRVNRARQQARLIECSILCDYVTTGEHKNDTTIKNLRCLYIRYDWANFETLIGENKGEEISREGNFLVPSQVDSNQYY